jgi:hypothetical protein
VHDTERLCVEISHIGFTLNFICNIVYIAGNTITATVSRFEVKSEETNVDGYVILDTVQNKRTSK